jgi:hypothetical protein
MFHRRAALDAANACSMPIERLANRRSGGGAILNGGRQ